MIRTRRGRLLGLDLLADRAGLAPGRICMKVPRYAPTRAAVPVDERSAVHGRTRFAVAVFTADRPDPSELPCPDGTARIAIEGGGSFHTYLRDALIADLGSAATRGKDGLPVRVHLTRLDCECFGSGHWHVEGTVRVGDGHVHPVCVEHPFAPTFHWADGARLASQAFPAAVAAFNRAVIARLG